MSGSRPTARLLFMWKSNQKHTNDAFDPEGSFDSPLTNQVEVYTNLSLQIISSWRWKNLSNSGLCLW